nr:MAG TPA: hypothetical protein [Caudoviricetes sp.]DAT58189.1 MAG TPA: hypothetical protein [Caudoviricetes sp.]
MRVKMHVIDGLVMLSCLIVATWILIKSTSE